MQNAQSTQSGRIRWLKTGGNTGNSDLLVYWMQASLRSKDNPALEYAIELARSRSLGMFVIFVLMPDYPGSQQRHYHFLCQGLKETAQAMKKRGVPFFLLAGNPLELALTCSQQAAVMVCDRGYLRHQRQWYSRLQAESACPLVQIEANTVMPVNLAYHKEAFSARVLRGPIHRQWQDYLLPGAPQTLPPPLAEAGAIGAERVLNDLPRLDPALIDQEQYYASQLACGQEAMPVKAFTGGEDSALLRWQEFLESGLDDYHIRRNDPALDGSSKMSPYLHFGMISPVRMALDAREYGRNESVDSLWEELIVRRELACNFTEYNQHYDSPECLPDWAITTINEHAGDTREYIYAYDELNTASTHDPYWNAAQNQLRQIGWMHGYLRMYWGKKIIEWTADVKTAWEYMIKMNDTWQLDGRDPNGYAGVAWCFGKHDRAWSRRPIFGKLRYMNDNGLRRKFDIDAYVRQWGKPG